MFGAISICPVFFPAFLHLTSAKMELARNRLLFTFIKFATTKFNRH